ncbi:2010_t:CDS:2, partial [Dentiscutata erythropus]
NLNTSRDSKTISIVASLTDLKLEESQQNETILAKDQGITCKRNFSEHKTNEQIAEGNLEIKIKALVKSEYSTTDYELEEKIAEGAFNNKELEAKKLIRQRGKKTQS